MLASLKDIVGAWIILNGLCISIKGKRHAYKYTTQLQNIKKVCVSV